MSAQAKADWLPKKKPSSASAEEKPFPEIGWRSVFKDYRAAMEGTTEACDAAHFTTLWAATAVGLGRKVEMYDGGVVYPNAYLALFGETGDKKTTGQRRMTQCKLLEHWPHIRLVLGVGSTEGLADALEDSEMGIYLFMWEEFATFLSQARWTGSTLLQFVTECFDCPDEWNKLYRNKPIDLQAVSSKPQAALEERFLSYITKHKNERVRRLQQKMSRYCGDAETFNRVLKSLVQADRIEIEHRKVRLTSD